ncbi:MAG: ABC transporter substrate-binding protein [Bryobacterales bacterium]|nr:ABC transporter substrate-binding protein [Bryobacterales bacterium]
MMMKLSLPQALILIILLGAVPQAFSSTENLSCSDYSITAGAVRTTEDVQAFVQCAYEFVHEAGFEEARRAFYEDERWRRGQVYVFVSEVTPMTDQTRSLVFPPDPSREGTIFEELRVDAFGNYFYQEWHRILSTFGEGWIYYGFTNPATGRDEPKASYVKSIVWDGTPAAIGAGIYRRDIPGTCESDEVNAMGLETDPSEERLQEFVRCAAMELESKGYFATIPLSTDPRWKHGSIYLFGVDTYGSALFSGDPDSGQPGAGASELNDMMDGPFGGRDVVSVGDAFGETLLYYTARNPASGMMQRKVTFVKRVVAHGLPILVGAGYYPGEGVPPGPGEEDNGIDGDPERPTGNDSESAGQGGSATLLFWQAPTILNPYLSSGTKDAEAASLVIEPLAEYNPNGEIVAVLAARVPTLENGSVSDDRTRITWNIREGVVWSDGTPLTANDVVFTWRYCSAPGGGCATASSFENVASVDAVAERTVTITFDGPTSFPYAPFVSHRSPILQASQFADCLGEAAADCTDANYGPIGTGPYIVTDFRTNNGVLYRFNPLYRGVESGLPSFGEVILKGGGDAAAAARSVLQLNEADYAWNLQVEPEILASISAGGGGTVVSAFATSVERLMLNQTNPDASLGDLRSEYADGTNPHPFLTDPVVGRALSLAIDRDTLVKTGYGDQAGRPTCNVWPAPPAQASTNNDECFVQNLSLAKEILDDAGIVDSDRDGVREREGVPLKILFQTSTNSVRQTTQELIKGWWAELGVETVLKNISPSVFFGGDPDSPDTVGRFYSDVQMYADGGIGVDPEGYLGSWISTQIAGAANSFLGRNVQRFQSDEYDRLYDELQNTIDMEQRNQITIALNDLLVESYSIIPLIHRGNVSAHSNDIEGVRMNAWDSELWNFETWTRRN